VAQQQQIIGDPRKVELAKSLGEEIGRLSDEYENLEARIRQSNPRYADLIRATPPTLTDLQNSSMNRRSCLNISWVESVVIFG